MSRFTKFLKNSRLVGVMAQAGVVLGSIDMSSLTPVLPQKVVATLTIVSGVISWYNRSFGRRDPASDGGFLNPNQTPGRTPEQKP